MMPIPKRPYPNAGYLPRTLIKMSKIQAYFGPVGPVESNVRPSYGPTIAILTTDRSSDMFQHGIMVL